jgi:excisionase family DNA binding protein
MHLEPHLMRNDTTTPTPITRLLVTVEEAAMILGLGRSKVYELIAADELETIHVGRSCRVPVAGLHEFVERRRASTPPIMSSHHRATIDSE